MCIYAKLESPLPEEALALFGSQTSLLSSLSPMPRALLLSLLIDHGKKHKLLVFASLLVINFSNQS